MFCGGQQPLPPADGRVWLVQEGEGGYKALYVVVGGGVGGVDTDDNTVVVVVVVVDDVVVVVVVVVRFADVVELVAQSVAWGGAPALEGTPLKMQNKQIN